MDTDIHAPTLPKKHYVSIYGKKKKMIKWIRENISNYGPVEWSLVAVILVVLVILV
jgi:hypothetical protein